MIRFKSEKERSRFYIPTEDKVEEVEIEIRYDPLTEKPSRILEKPLPISPEPDISDVEKAEDDFCPFCPENIYEVGARDVEVLSRDYLERGEAVLLANVTPYSKHSMVVRLSEDHYLPLDEFEEDHFIDALHLAGRYIGGLEKDTAPLIIMNYLKPAGSSIVHPHLQILQSEAMMDYQSRLIRGSEEYYLENDRNYWLDLLDEEKGGERYIGETGDWSWITPFAPRGLEHIQGIHTGDFLGFPDEDICALAEGIVKVLRTYHEVDHNSFNLSIFLPPGGETDRTAAVIDLVARSNLDRFYWCDVFAMGKLMDEAYSNRRPEEVAADARRNF